MILDFIKRKAADIRAVYGVFLRNHIFSHPDFTVGYGITPYHARGSQTILPVGNLTLPRR